MSAELTPEEAREQLALWTSKLTEAESERDRFDRLSKGYARMVEGLKLIHPEIGDEPPTGSKLDTDARGGVVDEPANSQSIRTEDAVLSILRQEETSPNSWLTPKRIAKAIVDQKLPIESDKPEIVVRKFLSRARARGLVIDRQLDGRTKGYRLSPKTSESDALTPLSDSATTRWAGGDADAAPPAVVQDHGEDPGRDARDLDWQNRVVALPST